MTRVNALPRSPSDPVRGPALARAELSVCAAAWLAGQPLAFLEDTTRAQGQCRRAEPAARGRWWPRAGDTNHREVTRSRPVEREVAERLCGACPARLACLALSYGLREHGRWGIWGGLAAEDRDELRGLWQRARAGTSEKTPGRAA